MLSYEPEDDEWRGWNGGFLNNNTIYNYDDEDYDEDYDKKRICCKYCNFKNRIYLYICFSFCSCLLIGFILFFFYFNYGGGNILCFIQTNNMCNKVINTDVNGTVYAGNGTGNGTVYAGNGTGAVGFYNNLTYNNVSGVGVGVGVGAGAGAGGVGGRAVIIHVRGKNSTNLTENYYSIQNDINNKIIDKKKLIDKKKINDGEALALSISIVFVFIGMLLCCFFSIKYKCAYCAYCKKYITNKSASRCEIATIDEVNNNFKVEQINPIFLQFNAICKKTNIHNNSLTDVNKDNIKFDTHFFSAVKCIKEAVKKDNELDYEEAISLYNKGIDKILYFMEHKLTSQERFKISQKVDVYIRRVKYLQQCILNKK